MNKFHGQFEKISESTLFRYQQGGLLGGDYVTIKKDALKHEALKQLSPQYKAILEQAIKNKTVLRVSVIKSGKSEAFNGPVDASNIPSAEMWADLYVEYAPGMWKDPMTLPICALEKTDVGGDMGMEGYPQYDKKLVRPNRSDDDVEEVDQTKGKDENRKLPKNNTKLANTKSPKDGRDSTKIKKESVGMKNENDLIFEGYRSHIIKEGLVGDAASKISSTLGRAGQAVGQGIQNVGKKISDVSSKWAGKNPEQIASEFSTIKQDEGEEALKRIISQLQQSNPALLKSVIDVAMKNVDDKSTGSAPMSTPDSAPESIEDTESVPEPSEEEEVSKVKESMNMLRENDLIFEGFKQSQILIEKKKKFNFEKKDDKGEKKDSKKDEKNPFAKFLKKKKKKK
jgi:hypothetical protein